MSAAIKPIPELLTAPGQFEAMEDVIGEVILVNARRQQELAAQAGADPAEYDLAVYVERSRPWEPYLNGWSPQDPPIVNLWYASGTFDGAKAGVADSSQPHAAVYNIDCYGFGGATTDPTDQAGHVPGDVMAARSVKRAVRQVRAYLMAVPNYHFQQAPGLVWRRWVQSIDMFQPEVDGDAQQHLNVEGARIAVAVEFNEYNYETAGHPVEYVAVDVHRADDGKLILEADYDYT